MQRRIKDLFLKNWSVKIIALALALLLWFMVSEKQDPVVSRSISVTVEYTDSDWLESEGYMVTGSVSSVTIPYTIRKSNIGKVKSEDFHVSVSLKEFLGNEISTVPSTTKYPLEITKSQSASYIEDWSYPKVTGQYVELSIDAVQSVSYPVRFSVSGEPSGDYQTMSLSSDPAQITVKGPVSDFGNLVSVKALVNLTSVTPDENVVSAGLALYDANDRVINNKNLTLSTDSVKVTVVLSQSKEVGISVTAYSGQPAEGYGCSSFDYVPKTVTVISSSKSSLANLSAISIPAELLDLAGASESKTVSIDISDFLPEDVSLAEGQSSSVEVSFEIEKLAEETFTVNTDVFSVIGEREDCDYEILSDQADITLTGFQDDLDSLKDNAVSLQGVINVEGLEPDSEEQTVPVFIEMDERFKVAETVTVKVRVAQKE